MSRLILRGISPFFSLLRVFGYSLESWAILTGCVMLYDITVIHIT